MVDFICKKLTEWFDQPCAFNFEGLEVFDFMADSGYCDEHCRSDGEIGYSCWKNFFEKLKEIEDHG